MSKGRHGLVSIPIMAACKIHECDSWPSFCFDVDCCVTGEHYAHHSTKQAQALSLEAHRAVPIAGYTIDRNAMNCTYACKCLDLLVGRGPETELFPCSTWPTDAAIDEESSLQVLNLCDAKCNPADHQSAAGRVCPAFGPILAAWWPSCITVPSLCLL